MTPMDWIVTLYDSVHPVVYWSSGAGMLVISMVDRYVFAFHPLQKNIFLDQEDQMGEDCQKHMNSL